MGPRPRKEASSRYWLVVGVLIALGALTIFSVGLYLWFLAAALALLSPFRARRRIFLPGLALFVVFLIAYVLIAPWGCSQSLGQDAVTGEETVSPVVCTSPIGIEYTGPEPFDPSRTPALVVAGITAIVAAAATRAVATLSHRSPTQT